MGSPTGPQRVAGATRKMYRGWDSIAAALDVSRWTAMRYAARAEDRLPVGSVRGRPACFVDDLEAWAARQIVGCAA